MNALKLIPVMYLTMAIALSGYSVKNFVTLKQEVNNARTTMIERAHTQKTNSEYDSLKSKITRLRDMPINTMPESIVYKAIASINADIVVANIKKPSSTPSAPPVQEATQAQPVDQNQTQPQSIPTQEIDNSTYITIRGEVRKLLDELDGKMRFSIVAYSNHDVEEVTIRVGR